MIKWREAYERLKSSPEFLRYFGQGKLLPPYAFRPLAFIQSFTFSTGIATGNPTPQNFPAGAVVLGITASAFTDAAGAGAPAAFPNVPSFAWGRRDLFALSFTYSGDENLTPGGPGNAEALLGNGQDTIFPARELLIAPSQTLITTVRNRSSVATAAAPLIVDVVFHCMVPRAVS